MPKRAPLRLENLQSEDPAPAVRPRPLGPVASGMLPEATTTVYARVPWTLGERLRDRARERSREAGRRVTVNDLVVEALERLLAG
jgi:hypothetical protein